MMQLDHLAFAAGPEGLDETTRRLGGQLGASFVDGGFHPRFGTQNRILPLAGGQYLEVVEVLDHPAAEKAPFGPAVRARSEIAGDHDRVDEWLGGKANLVLEHLDIEWVAPNGQPGIVAAVFATPNGLVRL